MRKKALIFGVDGQDGSLMSDFLIKKKYKVTGTFKNRKLKNLKKLNIYNKLKLIKCDITNFSKINLLINKNLPDEIYNFAGVSTLNKSENNFLKNDQVNNHAVLNILSNLKDQKKSIKFFQSLSSEIFRKKSKLNLCNEKSKFDINNAYSISKITSYYYLKLLRDKYKLKLYSGFLFNHASYYSRNDFLIKKIVENFYKMKNNKLNKIIVGNLESKRDWIYSKDLVKIVWKITQLRKPDDFVIGTGKLFTVKEVITEVANNFGFNLKWKKYQNRHVAFDKITKKILVETNKIHKREENNFVVADIRKLKKMFKGIKIINFKKMIKLICDDQKKLGI